MLVIEQCNLRRLQIMTHEFESSQQSKTICWQQYQNLILHN